MQLEAPDIILPEIMCYCLIVDSWLVKNKRVLNRLRLIAKKENVLLTHFVVDLKYNENVKEFRMSQIDNLLHYMQMHLV